MQPRIIALQDAINQEVSFGKTDMADHTVPHFQNDIGAAEIEIGAEKFMCCGASEPYDHPHVYLDMGTEGEIVCPYCSTLYRYNKELSLTESRPENCLFTPQAA